MIPAERALEIAATSLLDNHPHPVLIGLNAADARAVAFAAIGLAGELAGRFPDPAEAIEWAAAEMDRKSAGEAA